MPGPPRLCCYFAPDSPNIAGTFPSIHAPCLDLATAHRYWAPMQFRLATWNINSIRLRVPLVAKFVAAYRPDVLCLQEIKCVDELFPMDALQALGFPHIRVNGQAGYHGVAILSRFPL